MSPLSSPQTRRGYLDRPGCRLYYEVTGAGPAIVFAHGLGGNHLSWWQQVPHFAGRYTCVTFAHRGFAPSSEIPGGPDPADYAGDLAALIDQLALDRVFLVAQSMGGWASLEYALAKPERVRGLVLASTAGAIARRGARARGGPPRCGTPRRSPLGPRAPRPPAATCSATAFTRPPARAWRA